MSDISEIDQEAIGSETVKPLALTESTSGAEIIKTTWTMAQDDINHVTTAEQRNSWTLQVDGSNNPVTWLTQTPMQVITIGLGENDYGAFISDDAFLNPEDGTIFDATSKYPVRLGTCYSWSGSNLIIDTFNDCDKSSVKLTNNSTGDWTFGLTKYNPKTRTQQPLCADLVLQKQPVVYTPILTMYAKVGSTKSPIIDGTGSWTKFEITSLDASFHYDHASSAWAVN